MPDLSGVTSFFEQNEMIEKLIFVLLVVIVFVILMSVGTNIMDSIFQPTSPYIIKGMISGNTTKVISQDPKQSGAIPLPRSTNEAQGIEFTWSVWLNIANLDVLGQYKHIFSKGDNVTTDNGMSSPNNAPGLYLSPSTNSLVVQMNTFTMINETIEIPDIPLNSWINVIIRVEGSYLDAYINGVLVKRLVLNGVPKQNNGSIYVAMNNGFNGYLSDLRYYNEALQPGDILAIVKRGPSITVSDSQGATLKQQSNLAMQWYFEKS